MIVVTVRRPLRIDGWLQRRPAVHDQEEYEAEFAVTGLDPVVAQGKRILVVEDDEDVGHYLVDLLSEYRCEVFGPAATGSRAIEFAQARRPDLALIDIGLKGAMDGIHTAIELQARFAIPAVFLSGTVDPLVRERARAASPLDFLQKPYLPAHLEAVLRKAFEHKQP